MNPCATKGSGLIFSSNLFRTALLIIGVLLVPIIPFVIFGEQLESWLTGQFFTDGGRQVDGAVSALMTVVVLAVDILLPVPSSVVMTFAGAVFGILPAVLLCWLGFTLSSALGYWLGYQFGLPLARRLCSEQDLQLTAYWIERYGQWLLVTVRGMPVVAEASALVAGIYTMSARRFWPPVIIANLVLAILFATLGHFAADEGWLVRALFVSMLAPPLLLLAWLWLMSRR